MPRTRKRAKLSQDLKKVAQNLLEEITTKALQGTKIETINLAQELQKIEGINDLDNEEVAEILVGHIKKRDLLNSLGQGNITNPTIETKVSYFIKGFKDFRPQCIKEIEKHHSTTLGYHFFSKLRTETLQFLFDNGLEIKDRYITLCHAFNDFSPAHTKRDEQVNLILNANFLPEENERAIYTLFEPSELEIEDSQGLEALRDSLELILKHDNIENHRLKNLFHSIFDGFLDCFSGNFNIEPDDKDDFENALKSIARLLFEHGVPLKNEEDRTLNIASLIKLELDKTLSFIVETYLEKSNPNRSIEDPIADSLQHQIEDARGSTSI